MTVPNLATEDITRIKDHLVERSSSPVEVIQATEALQITEISMQTISTLLNLSMWVLGLLAVLLAIISVFGWVTIRSAAVNTVKNIANKYLDNYTKSEEFKQMIEDKLSEVIEKRWQNTVVIKQFEAPKRKQEKSEFLPKPGDDDDNHRAADDSR